MTPFTRTASAIVALSAWLGLALQWIDFLSITADIAVPSPTAIPLRLLDAQAQG